MQQERASLLWLTAQISPVVDEVLQQLHQKFTCIQLHDEDELSLHLISKIPTVLLVQQKYLASAIEAMKDNSREQNENMVLIALGSRIDETDQLFDVIPEPVEAQRLLSSLQHAHNHLLMKQEISQLRGRLNLQTNELHELNLIGVALSAERDPDKLLELILRKSREITHADAGSLYLVESKDGMATAEKDFFVNKQLRFKLAQNDSVPIELTEFVMPIERKSIAGYVALSGQVLNIPDVYHLPAICEFEHNRKFDESIGYRAKSMLVIPMKTHKDEIIGVLQLINRKKDWHVLLQPGLDIDERVISFDSKCVDLASSLASQAAVSIENSRLYEEIKNLFDGFVHAAVLAIEQRDPTTFGHSERVATLTTALAKAVDRVQTGRLKDVSFSRSDIQTIHYASLLHDFGKIGVREPILVKAKKLFPHELDSVKYRFRIIKQSGELKFSREKIFHLISERRRKALATLNVFDNRLQQFHELMDQYLKIIDEANEPTVLKQSGYESLSKIATIIFEDNGRREMLLTSNEVQRLSIPKGSLSDEERREIESHVTHTFKFLSKIPWTTELKGVPQIAHAHHEKLDGSGYPQHLKETDIPMQSRMMTIADIYDALTAWDRPYKKAVPVEKALDILKWEVKDGKLDADLFQLFIECKIYELAKKPEP